MSPQIDFCFKELMSVEFIRRGFILAVLGLEEEEVAGSRLMPTEIGGDRQEEKLIIMDVFVSLRDGTNINMEIQVIEIREWKNRSVFYLCKNIARQLRKGQGYESSILSVLSVAFGYPGRHSVDHRSVRREVDQ